MYALVDCNNFFASCEIVFNPKLRKIPLVILSSNDGCVIARSKEAKVLGIPMCAPLFTFENLIKTHNVVTLSANFSLYSDMSARVMATLASFSFFTEIYSIDEAFLHLEDYKEEALLSLAASIQKKVLQDTGVPVSIGIAETKTLAKIAAHKAKKSGDPFVITKDKIDESIKNFPAQDIWGIGKNSAEKLKTIGVHDALTFKYKEEALIKKHLTVMGLRILHELNGKSCLETNPDSDETKSILSSRTFASDISDFSLLKSALAQFCHLASKKLRQKKLLASFITLFIQTNRFAEKPYESFTAKLKLPIPTSSTSTLLVAVEKLLRSIYKKELSYKRGGILLTDFSSEDLIQQDLLHKANPKEKALNTAIDKVHGKYGSRTLVFAAELSKNKWHKTPLNKSKAYTTSWDELPIVKAKH